MELMGNMRARQRMGRLWPPCKDTERWFAGAGESSMVPGLRDPGASVAVCGDGSSGRAQHGFAPSLEKESHTCPQHLL